MNKVIQFIVILVAALLDKLLDRATDTEDIKYIGGGEKTRDAASSEASRQIQEDLTQIAPDAQEIIDMEMMENFNYDKKN